MTISNPMNSAAARTPLRRDQALVLVIDVQERLLAAMVPAAAERLVRGCVTLLRGAAALGVAVTATEQYPRGLGPTVEPIRAALPAGFAPPEKLDFSAYPVLRGTGGPFAEGPPRPVIVCGMETHVCVYQTVRDLCAAGHQVVVVQDAVLSRTDENRAIGLGLIRDAGAALGSVESVLFDLCGRAGTPEFKAISALVK